MDSAMEAIELTGADTEEQGGGTRALSSSLRTLAMLDTMAGFPRPFRFPELSKLVGGSRAGNYQKLITLVAAGWVEALADGYYRLSLHAVRVGGAAQTQAGLGLRLRPLMETLSAELGESVSLVVCDRDVLYIIDEVLTRDLLQVSFRVGTTMTLEQTASGRVFAAFMSEAELAALKAEGVPLPDDAVLAEVRRTYYATSKRAQKSEILAIGAPIFDVNRRCIAVLSVAGPYDRIDVEAGRLALMRTVSRFMNQSGGWKPWGDAYG